MNVKIGKQKQFKKVDVYREDLSSYFFLIIIFLTEKRLNIQSIPLFPKSRSLTRVT